MILVDSSVWIGFFNDQSTPQIAKLKDLLATADLLMGDLVIVEVLQGFRSDREVRMVEALFRGFNMVPLSSPSLAFRAAANYRRLRRAGLTVRKTIDVIIGTYCIEHGCALLHDDRDFDPMVEYLGLQVIGG